MIDKAFLSRGGSKIVFFRQGIPIVLLVLLVVGLAPALAAQESTDEPRPEAWSQAVELEGVPNLFQVSDSLYRSAQPTAEGMQNLSEAGIETIVNLRSFHSDRDLIGETGLAYEHIYMKAWHPEETEAVRFLQIVTNGRRTPVLVHCQRGADRTGAMCAVYRIAVDGWTKEAAIEEMTDGGYGFDPTWENLVEWIEELDIDDLRERAGIDPVTADTE